MPALPHLLNSVRLWQRLWQAKGGHAAAPTLSSHSSGKGRRISRGSASADMTMSSAMPRFSVLVAVGGKGAIMSGMITPLDVLARGRGCVVR